MVKQKKKKKLQEGISRCTERRGITETLLKMALNTIKINTIQQQIREKKVFLPFTLWIPILAHEQQTAFENIVVKEEIARNEQFLLFPQCFLLNQ